MTYVFFFHPQPQLELGHGGVPAAPAQSRFSCTFPGCRCQCRTRNALTKHVRATHLQIEPQADSDSELDAAGQLELEDSELLVVEPILNQEPAPGPSTIPKHSLHGAAPGASSEGFCPFPGCTMSFKIHRGLKKQLWSWHPYYDGGPRSHQSVRRHGSGP